MKWREQARVLLAKADEDLYILRALLDDRHISNEMWGFHAQQAIEKLIKALLSYRQIRYPFTHHLRELAELAQRGGVQLEAKFDPLLELTPYAAELRYATLSSHENEVPLNRASILSLLESLRQYITGITSL